MKFRCYRLSFRIKIKEESNIRVNTRELNRISSKKFLSYIY